MFVFVQDLICDKTVLQLSAKSFGENIGMTWIMIILAGGCGIWAKFSFADEKPIKGLILMLIGTALFIFGIMNFIKG